MVTLEIASKNKFKFTISRVRINLFDKQLRRVLQEDEEDVKEAQVVHGSTR